MRRLLRTRRVLFGAAAIGGVAIASNDASWPKQEIASPKLLQVTVIHRHGARTPVSHQPGESASQFREAWRDQCSDWEEKRIPCEPGLLTDLGKQQLLLIGQSLRERYLDTGFLPTTFDAAQLAIRSTDFARTRMSASYLVQGLFPGTPIAKIQQALQMRKAEEETLFPRPFACSRLLELLHTAKRSPEYLAVVNQPHIIEFRKILAGAYGIPEHKMPSIIALIDPPKCLAAHSLPLAAPWDGEMFDALDQAAGTLFGLNLQGAELTKLASGSLLKEIVDNMEDIIRKPSPQRPQLLHQDKRRLWVLSGHDTTILPLAHILKVWDRAWPPFASHFVLELLEDTTAEDEPGLKEATQREVSNDSHLHGAAAETPGGRKLYVRLVYNGRERGCVPYMQFRQYLAPFLVDNAHLDKLCVSKSKVPLGPHSW